MSFSSNSFQMVAATFKDTVFAVTSLAGCVPVRCLSPWLTRAEPCQHMQLDAHQAFTALLTGANPHGKQRKIPSKRQHMRRLSVHFGENHCKKGDPKNDGDCVHMQLLSPSLFKG